MWETIASWVALGCVVVAVIWGRRASKAKANRLRAEGGRAALAAHLSQSVTVNTDARSMDVRNTTANNVAAHDDPALDRAVTIILARILGGSNGGIGLAAGDSATALGLSGSAGRDLRDSCPSGLSDDDALRVLQAHVHVAGPPRSWYSDDIEDVSPFRDPRSLGVEP